MAMKKTFIIGAAIAALTASAGAKAADIVTYQQAPAAVAAAPAQINWNGFYVGGTIGGSWANGRNKTSLSYSDVDAEGVSSSGRGVAFNRKIKPASFIGGIYAGYNFQPGFLSETALKDVVFGLETDWLWNGGSESVKGTSTLAGDYYDDEGGQYVSDPVSAIYRTRLRQEWNGATRIRAGYALGSEGRFMPYVAAGVSYAKMSAKTYVEDLEGDPDEDGAKSSFSSAKSKIHAGWNIGAGIDYVPPILNDHIVLRAEYRFTGFGEGTYNAHYSYTDAYDDSVRKNMMKQKVNFNQNDFRVGIAYKF